MLNPYLQILQLIGLLHTSEIEELMLTPTKDKDAEKFCEMLSDSDSATKALKSNTLILSEVRIFFDSVVSGFLNTIVGLSTSYQLSKGHISK